MAKLLFLSSVSAEEWIVASPPGTKEEDYTESGCMLEQTLRQQRDLSKGLALAEWDEERQCLRSAMPFCLLLWVPAFHLLCLRRPMILCQAFPCTFVSPTTKNFENSSAHIPHLPSYQSQEWRFSGALELLYN